MERNINLTRGLIHSQQVLLTLVQKGMARDDAYRKVQTLAMRAWTQEENFKELVKNDPEIMQVLTAADFKSCFDLAYHTKHVDGIFKRLKLM
jgi:adenylosuccinate lyase